MTRSAGTSAGSVVRHPAVAHVLLWTALPVLGAGTGWLLTRLPGWVSGLPWAPFQEPLTRLAPLVGPAATVVLLGLGAVAGCLCALMAYDEVTTVRVDPGGVTVTRADRTTAAGREDVAAVFCDGRDLVLLRPDGGEAARERTWHRPVRLRRAFSAEGWPWRDGDPYAAEYSRWVEGLPDVGAREEALLRARHAALRSGDAADAGALREELGRLGVVVRDEGRRQYWRRVHAVGD